MFHKCYLYPPPPPPLSLLSETVDELTAFLTKSTILASTQYTGWDKKNSAFHIY
jgi:hypothetical protein